MQHREFGLPDLIARSGHAGRRFEEEYRSPACQRVRWGFQRALDTFRGLRLVEGHRLLEEAGGQLRELADSISAPVRRILAREHFSILAYYFYLQEDTDRSEELLAAAQEEVRSAIEMQPCLLPQAHHSLEYCFQRARIARSRRRWEEMRRILEVAHGMVDDRVPLCVMDSGAAIFYSTIETYFHSLHGLGDIEAAYVREMTDRVRRRRKLDLFVQNLYIIPGFVIPRPAEQVEDLLR